MAEETAPAAPDAPTPEPKVEGGSTFTQEQVNDLIAREKGRFQQKYGDYDDLKSKATELDQIREANASELEKAQKSKSKAEQERDESRSTLLRFQIANEKEVPADAVEFLRGSTREELEASAEKLLAIAKPETTPDFNGGAREPAPEPLSPEQQHNRDALKVLGLIDS